LYGNGIALSPSHSWCKAGERVIEKKYWELTGDAMEGYLGITSKGIGEKWRTQQWRRTHQKWNWLERELPRRKSWSAWSEV